MFSDQFEIIPVIVKAKSFSKAAQLLHLSQPAISSKIQAMEDYYGIKLFNRTAQGVTLTEAGKIVMSYTANFLDLHEAMEADLNKLKNVSNPQLIIGSSCTSGNYAVPGSILGFKQKHPSANIKLDIANTANTVEKLGKGEIDVAIVDGPVECINRVVCHLDTIKLVFIDAHTGVRRKSKISLKELKSMPLVVREKGAAMRVVLEELAINNGWTMDDFNVTSEMNSIQSIKAAVQGGSGITLVPLVAVQKEIAEGTLRIVQVDNHDLSIDVNLIYSSEEEPSPIARKFIKYLTDKNKNGFCWNNTV